MYISVSALTVSFSACTEGEGTIQKSLPHSWKILLGRAFTGNSQTGRSTNLYTFLYILTHCLLLCISLTDRRRRFKESWSNNNPFVSINWVKWDGVCQKQSHNDPEGRKSFGLLHSSLFLRSIKFLSFLFESLLLLTTNNIKMKTLLVTTGLPTIVL